MMKLNRRLASEHNPAHDPPTLTGATHSRRLALIAVALLVVLATAGVGAARWIRSPAQAAADAAPPDRSILTAPVTTQVVKDTVVVRGTVTPSAPVTVPLPGQVPSSAASQSSSDSTQASGAAGSGQKSEAGGSSGVIISATPIQPGGTVSAGKVIVEVSGRPVIALPGAIPAYRDMRPGDEGPDIKQLQQALNALGLGAGSADGTFGAQTKDAVRRLYQSVGYPVASTSGVGDPPDATVTSAKTALTQAQRALQDAQTAAGAAASPAPSPGAGTSTTGASGSAGTLAVQRAQQDLATAQQAYNQAVANSGPMLPMAEVAFVPTLPARLVSLGAALGQSPTTSIATLDSGEPVVIAQADPGQVTGLRTGMGATLTDDAQNFTAQGTITAIGQPTASNSNGGSGGQQVAVTITPSSAIPDSEMNANLQVTIDQASSNGDVLAVPIAAITARADGTTYVTRLASDGTRTQVSVTTGVVGEGMVEVTPKDGAELAAGDKVVTSQ